MHHRRAVHVAEVRCRRVRCRGCGHRWQVLPRGVVPNKHYQPSVVALGVAQLVRRATKAAIAVTLTCSRRTVGRWVASLRQALSGPATATWERYGGRIARLLPFATANLAIMPEVAH